MAAITSSSAANPSRLFDKLHDKQVLVFGGTSGMGFAVARGALEAGSRVHISSSNQAKVDSSIARLQSFYPEAASKISGSVCDLANTDALLPSFRNVFDQVGRPVDHIAYTAGDSLKLTPLTELTPEDISKAGAVRFLAPFILARVALEPGRMVHDAASSITLTSGTRSERPAKDWTVVGAYGAGIEGMTRGLALNMAPIRANVVSPGAVLTELFGRFPKDQLEVITEQFRMATTTGQVGQPEDVAEAYLYSMRDKYCAGRVITSDGGKLLV